jgi:hypothetical protein
VVWIRPIRNRQRHFGKAIFAGLGNRERKTEEELR